MRPQPPRGHPCADPALQILPGRHILDRARRPVLFMRDQRTNVDDPFALLSGYPRPVVRVRGVRQVLVLLELVADREEQIVLPKPLLVGLEEALDRLLLRARN